MPLPNSTLLINRKKEKERLKFFILSMGWGRRGRLDLIPTKIHDCNGKMCCAKSLQSFSLRSYGLYYTCQAPLSMGFSRQEYWHGLPCPPPGDLPNPGIKPVSPALTGRFFYHCTTREAPNIYVVEREIVWV